MDRWNNFPKRGEDTNAVGCEPVILEILVIDLTEEEK